MFLLLLFVGITDVINEAWITAKSEAQLPHVNHILTVCNLIHILYITGMVTYMTRK